MKKLLRHWLLILWAPFTVWAAPSVLNGGSHAATFIAPAVNAALGAGHVDSDIFIDQTADTNFDPVTQFQNTSGTPFTSVASGTPDNHAVYGVLNLSHGGYTPNVDKGYYTTLQPAGAVYSWPLYVQGGALPANSPPPVVLVVSSSTNSTNGGTGPGIEFGLSASYKGLDTTADSWVSAEMAGFLAAIKFNHSTWTWFDVKAALRQTASNWATGYNSSNFGYGTINYDNATAISSTSSLYLQPPQVSAAVVSNTIQLTIYPFRQTRRHHEVVYAVPSGYSWPVKNEYALSDITASGATLVFTGNNTDLTPSGTASGLINPGTYQIIAFTTDNAGNYSRVESFSAVTTPAISCL